MADNHLCPYCKKELPSEKDIALHVELEHKNEVQKQAMPTLFDKQEYEPWKQEWKDMPEYEQKDLMPFRRIIVNFTCQEDVNKFAEVMF